MYEFKTIFKRKHRIVCLFLSCFLCFGTVSSQYLTVQAFDWVAPSVYLPFDGAIPYLMGLLGVSSSDKSLFTEEQYRQYLLENGYTEEDLNNNSRYADWVDDVCNGALDQASEYWTKFKEWIKSKSYNVSAFNVSDLIHSVKPNANLSSLDSNYFGLAISNAFYYSYNGETTFYFFSNSYIDSIDNSSHNIKVNGTIGSLDYFYITVKPNNSISFSSIYNTSSVSIGYRVPCFVLGFEGLPIDSDVFKWDYSIPSQNIVISLDPSIIDKLSFVLSDAISTAIPGVIPLPWDQIGDTVDEITDTIDGLIEQVQAGVLSIEAYMEAVLEMVGAIAVDTATGLLYPQDPDKPDETLDDKANENKGNLGFTLFGLEKVFPFCIPFDIYAFLTLLVAEPVAPVINWPVYNPVTHNNEIITIDFSTWQSVVTLFRYIFDFLFIIGMLLMARALIGGGDSA